MSNSDVTPRFILWQQLVIQAQELAIEMPEMGLNVEALSSQPLERLTRIHAFLEHKYTNKHRLVR